MDEFTDEDVQLQVESEDDTRFSFTIVSISGRKLSASEVIMTLEMYLHEAGSADEERSRTKALNH